MAAPIIPQIFIPGPRLIDGSDLNNAMANDLAGSQDTLTATGTTRATATQLTVQINRFSTVGASGQCILPPCKAGEYVIIYNYGANTLTVIGFLSTDTIDGAASVTISAATRGALFYCLTPGAWYSSALGATTT